MRVSLFDYGAGNLHSLAKALAVAGSEVRIESDPLAATDADVLVLPGAGAFGPAAARLAPARSLVRERIEAGLPCLGVCLGMHLLFEGSDEGEGEGLGLFAGRVRRFETRRVPQIGWNAVEEARDPLFDRAPLTSAYYANSFVCVPRSADAVIAWSTHEGRRFPAAVRRGRALGLQFHPEKSGAAGVRLVQAFLAECAS